MTNQIHILMLEDSPEDADIVQNLLLKLDPLYRFRTVPTKTSFYAAMEDDIPDVVLADNSLVNLNGMEALRAVQHYSLNIPFIMVTGFVSEEFAAEIMKQGADDYILKHRLHKLQPAIVAALRQKKLSTEKTKALNVVTQSEENLKAVFSSASEAFILADIHGRITDFNHNARKIMNPVSGREAQVGDTVMDLAESSRKTFVRSVLNKVLNGEIVQYDHVFREDGLPDRWVNISYNPVKKRNVISGICITGRDITENKLAEQQKEFDQNNLYALINNTKDLMWSVDTEFKLITFNQAFDNLIMQMSGKRPLKGDSIPMDEFDAEKLHRFRDYYERAFQNESFTAIEYAREPFEMWSELSFHPIHKGDAIVGTACFSRNITQKKKTEDEVRLSNERYKAVATATSDGIWDYDFRTNRTYIAGTGYKYLFGYDIVNQYSDPLFWESCLHPDDKERVLRELAASIADENRVQSTTEYRFLKKNGEYAYINDRYFILREKSKPVRMLGAKQDITIKKKVEQQLITNYQDKLTQTERMTSILNTLPAGIALLDEKGMIVSVNNTWENFREAHGNVGDPYRVNDYNLRISGMAGVKKGDEGTRVAEGIRDVLGNKILFFEFEYSYNGSESQKWFRMIATALTEKINSGAVIMHVDISEIRQLEKEKSKVVIEEQRTITRAVLKAQETERSRMGQELHNNISQLLAAVKMKLAVYLAYPEKSLENIRECLALIQEAVKEAKNLSHKMVLPLFAEHGFHESLELLISKYQRDDKKIDLRTGRLDQQKISTEIKEVLYRILQEQLNNIEKHAKASEVTVRLSTREKTIIMEITDNGLGFKSSKKTNGIGIANIHNRVKSFNGKSLITSEPGNGCTLWVELPIENA